MRIGLLTGGGDCPGLNAAIRAVVRVGAASGDEILGFRHGWRGVVEGDATPLTTGDTKGLLQSGGTILRTARYHPDEHDDGISAVLAITKRERLDALIVIGGDGTLTSASHLADVGVPIVAIAKTIDNDVLGTERCIGFDTAVATATEAIDRVQTTGESHDRLMVVEVMGRTAGWLAIYAGIAGGADALCLPEDPTDLDRLAAAIQRRHDEGSTSSVVVVAEGAKFLCSPELTKQSTGAVVSAGLAQRTGYETRLAVLGYIQRGGPPTASDRLLATRCGVAALEAVHQHALDTLVSVSNDTTKLVSLGIVTTGVRPVPEALLALARKMTVAL